MGNSIFFVAVGAYATAAVLLTYNHVRGITKPCVLSWWLVLAGFLAQSHALFDYWDIQKGFPVLNLTTSLDLSALTMGGLYLLWWRVRRLDARTVGVLLLPLMVFSLVASHLLPNAAPAVRVITHPLLILHLAFSLLAYGLFSIAAILALMDAFQEHALKTKHLGAIFTMLPPLDALEDTLFLMVRMGFALLTASMVSGGIYAYEQLGTALSLNHKQVFTWMTWLVFGILLLGRHYQGWRGRKAARFTLWGYLFLVMAFFGVKFVAEVILNKG